jgi:adenylate cyclase
VGLIGRVEQRVAFVGDSATRRFQKMLVVVTALVGSLATVFNAVPFFGDDLGALGWTYLASAVYLAAGAVVILALPRAFAVVTFVLLLDVLLFPSITQVLAGGYSSGVLAMPWTMFAPLGAALVLGARSAVVHLGLFAVAVLGVAALEPTARDIAPTISTQTLLTFNVGSLLSLGVLAAATSLYLLRQVERYRDQADRLLLNVLPGSIAERLKSGEQTIADRHNSVTVLFADIVDFTQLSSDADPQDVVTMLDELFTAFDHLAAKHGVEKIKTIGDAYMAAAGLPDPRPDHAAAALALARDMLHTARTHRGPHGQPLRLRIGINTGPVVAGVIGRQRLIYDLWGDAVNMASRMESTGVTGYIQVTQAVRDQLADHYRFQVRDLVAVKGKGMTHTYTLSADDPVPA